MIPSKEEWNAALEKRHGKPMQKRFSESTVAICGLGGLGSNISIALARAGVGKLILIDFDKVDVTNLHRQQYKASQVGRFKTDAMSENLGEIAPFVKIETHNEYIDENNAIHLLADADIVCEAFDNPECKAMLTNIVLEKMPQKYLVAASGMAGKGSANDIKTRKITEHFYLCGDEKSDISNETCLLSSRVMLCAAHQSHTVLRILSEERG